MAVSVRMNPILERQLDLAAKRRGVTKSQFIIAAVERALGHKNPYAEVEQPYDTDRSRAQMLAKLKAKHGVGRTR
jgi:hypothetical protein